MRGHLPDRDGHRRRIGAFLNPPGSLTGIPIEKLKEFGCGGRRPSVAVVTFYENRAARGIFARRPFLPPPVQRSGQEPEGRAVDSRDAARFPSAPCRSPSGSIAAPRRSRRAKSYRRPSTENALACSWKTRSSSAAPPDAGRRNGGWASMRPPSTPGSAWPGAWRCRKAISKPGVHGPTGHGAAGAPPEEVDRDASGDPLKAPVELAPGVH